MHITLELLQKRAACQEALDFFAKHYPDGAELIDLINRAHLPDQFLHWGFQHLETSEEEKEAYRKKMKIVDSVGVYGSSDINQSYIITDSRCVDNSNNIHSSKNVTNSNNIYNSTYIESSNQIWKSFVIENSFRVLDSKNVVQSNEVISSDYVVESSGVYESSNIVNSIAIWKSETMTNCGMCFGCHNLNHALFCEQIQDGEYMLFNKPIDKVRFNIIYRQFCNQFKPQLTLMSTTWQKGSAPRIYRDYRKHTQDISESFWEWVKTLPGYNPDILYSLTFNPQFLN